MKLTEFDPKDGGYGTDSASHVNDLGAFVRDLALKGGYYRGEGECYARTPK